MWERRARRKLHEEKNVTIDEKATFPVGPTIKFHDPDNVRDKSWAPI